MAAASVGGGSGLRRSATNIYRRLLNFDSPLAAMGLENVVSKSDEKLLKSSFYQAATMFILAVGFVGVYSLYYILSPFVKPILWAVLVGTVLHPLKLAISRVVRQWLKGIGENSSVPVLTVHTLLLPLTVTCSTVSRIQQNMIKFWMPICIASAFIAFLCLFVRCNFTIYINLAFIYKIFKALSTLWNVAVLPWPVYLTFSIGYIISTVLLPPQHWPPLLATVLPFVFWTCLSFLASALLGPYSMILIPTIVVPIVVKVLSVHFYPSPAKEEKREKLEHRKPSIGTLVRASDFISALSPRFSKSEIQKALQRSCLDGSSKSEEDLTKELPKTANIIILSAVWAVVFVKLIFHPILLAFMLPALILPSVWRKVTKSEYFSEKYAKLTRFGQNWFETRRLMFIPPMIETAILYMVKGDSKIRKMLQSCVEICVTCLLIVGVVGFFVLIVLFGAIQVHRETVYLFTMSNELLNNTLHPEVNRWLETADMNVTSLHEVASNAAGFGRQFFNSTVDAWIVSVPDAQRQQLKHQLLDAYDLMSTKLVDSWTKDFDRTLQQKHNPKLVSFEEAGFDFSSFSISSLFDSSWYYLIKENIASIIEVCLLSKNQI